MELAPRAAKSGYATEDANAAKALQHPAVGGYAATGEGRNERNKDCDVGGAAGHSAVRIQEPAAAPGYAVKVEFENEQIRVLRVHYFTAGDVSDAQPYRARDHCAHGQPPARDDFLTERLRKRSGVPANSIGETR